MNETTRTDKEALGQFLVHRLSEEDPTGAPLTVAELRRELLPYPVCRDMLDFSTKAEYDEAMLQLLSDEEWLVIEDDALDAALDEERASPEPGLAFLSDFSASFLHPGPRLTEADVEDDLEFLESLEAEAVAAEELTAEEPTTEEPTTEKPSSDEVPAVDEQEREGDRLEEPTFEWEDGKARAGTDAAGADAVGAASGSQAPAAAAAAGGGGGRPTSPSAGAGEASGNPAGVGGGACWSCDAELPARPDVRYCPFCGSDQTSPECLECRADLELSWSFCPACGADTGRP